MQGGIPPKPGLATRKPPNPKKLIYGCTGCFGGAILFFIIFVLIFAAQTTAAGDNPLARSLGVDTASFINTLITLVNLIFLGLEVILFLLVTVGMFRYFMARKDDKDAKKKGLSLAGISFLILIFLAGIWIGIILFLDTKKVRTVKPKTSIDIVTEPEVTLGLTAPVDIKFYAPKSLAADKNNEVLSYLWSFGDGDTSTVADTSHRFVDMGSNNGRYDVTLEVVKRNRTSKEEVTDTFNATVTIADVKINAEFTANPETGPAPLEVTFDASGSSAPAGEITKFEWDFNNDNKFEDADGASVTHTFEQLGDYPVNLRVTDNNGKFEVATKTIKVAEPNIPIPVIEIPSDSGKYYAGTQYTFKGDKSTSPNGEITKYEWDFGDNSPKGNTRTVSHTYKAPGTYEVVLKATDENNETGTAKTSIKVEIKESAPIAEIVTVPPPAKEEDNFISGTVPFEVKFDGKKSTDPDNNIVEYNWDFDGDGEVDASGETASYVYNKEGLFNATLTVIDAEDLESTNTLVVKVQGQPLQARLTADPVNGVIPLEVTFDASGSSYPGGKITTHIWDFGDGADTFNGDAKITHRYEKIGTFDASVTIRADDNSTSIATIPISVRAVSLMACFTPSVESGPVPLNVEFDIKCSQGTVARTSWDFGDGVTSNSRSPEHKYEKAGTYEVILKVEDSLKNVDTYTKFINVTGAI
jgi:PKD repeat protein